MVRVRVWVRVVCRTINSIRSSKELEGSLGICLVVLLVVLLADTEEHTENTS